MFSELVISSEIVSQSNCILSALGEFLGSVACDIVNGMLDKGPNTKTWHQASHAKLALTYL